MGYFVFIMGERGLLGNSFFWEGYVEVFGFICMEVEVVRMRSIVGSRLVDVVIKEIE